jgi:hypothetical protein
MFSFNTGSALCQIREELRSGQPTPGDLHVSARKFHLQVDLLRVAFGAAALVLSRLCRRRGLLIVRPPLSDLNSRCCFW